MYKRTKIIMNFNILKTDTFFRALQNNDSQSCAFLKFSDAFVHPFLFYNERKGLPDRNTSRLKISRNYLSMCLSQCLTAIGYD